MDSNIIDEYGVEYVTLEDGKGYVKNCNKKAERIVIKSEIDGCPISDIMSFVFRNDLALKEVVIEEGIMSIGIDAFKGCTELEAIYIPDSAEVISANAFKGCKKLKIYTGAMDRQKYWEQGFLKSWNPEKCEVVWDIDLEQVVSSGLMTDFCKADIK